MHVHYVISLLPFTKPMEGITLNYNKMNFEQMKGRGIDKQKN